MKQVAYTKRLLSPFLLILLAIAFMKGAVAAPAPRIHPRQQPSKAVDIPMRYDPILCSRLLVQVSINKAAPLSFIVDTGSNVGLVIDEWAAERLMLITTGEKFHTERGVVMDVTTIQNFRLLTSDQDTSAGHIIPVNQAVITNLHYPADLVPGTRVAGIIGLPILEFGNQAVRFDLAAHRMTLFHQELPDLYGRGAATLPMKEEGHQFFIQAAANKDVLVDMLIDTGAEAVFAPSALIDKFAVTPTPAVYEERMFNEGVRHLQIYEVNHLALGSMNEPDVVLHVGSRDKALLGLPILARFRFTLDFTRKRLLLERASDYNERIRLPGATVIAASRHEDVFTVENVVKDTTAERAGIQRGDEIVEIDHTAIKKLPPSIVQDALDGFADTTANIVVRRDMKEQTITFVRPSLFAFASGAPVGVGISVDVGANGRMTVSAVVIHSSAAEAGVQEGDEVLEVNGLVVGKASAADISKQTHQAEGAMVVLKLQRKGESKIREVKLQIRKLL